MMVVILLISCLLCLIAQVSPNCYIGSRRFCRNIRDESLCQRAIRIACSCSALDHEGCESYVPKNRLEQQIKRFGQKCLIPRCRLKSNWCSWSSWKTEYTNSSCEGNLYTRSRIRKKCCFLWSVIDGACYNRNVRIQRKTRRQFEKSLEGCVNDEEGMPWFEKLGYGVAVSAGFAFIVKCFGMCCRKRAANAQAAAGSAPTGEHLENLPLDPDDDQTLPPPGVPEHIVLNPSAPPPYCPPSAPLASDLPPSYEEVTERPQQFEPPTPEKRY